ncbi:MAG: cytochrome c1 [Rhodoferax sp.]|uniref:cytochrome c1 n=1 Tax=Rhodoferax sp. TaxID=50421 RepID=UPI001B66E1C1|nr:cytochrome c1 [Rhodoferax sp.]MBP9904879.1 cytochrome c1 [Rhodoferax sp.]
MNTMGLTKKVILSLMCVLGLAATVHANVAGPAWDKAPDKIKDMAALQSGAKTFVNYCLNCHSAAFMRYNRLQDIGLTPEQIKDNLLVTNAKLGETMIAAIDPKQAKAWFGVNPPDLTVIARSRAGAGGTGTDYLYSYMRGFYRDETKPTGWNNHVFPNVAMPHVLWELQGSLTPAQYDQTIGDLVNYLQWMAEPAQTTRKNIGLWVLAFLAILTFLTWRLNAVYWKDIK